MGEFKYLLRRPISIKPVSDGLRDRRVCILGILGCTQRKLQFNGMCVENAVFTETQLLNGIFALRCFLHVIVITTHCVEYLDTSLNDFDIDMMSAWHAWHDDGHY